MSHDMITNGNNIYYSIIFYLCCLMGNGNLTSHLSLTEASNDNRFRIRIWQTLTPNIQIRYPVENVYPVMP